MVRDKGIVKDYFGECFVTECNHGIECYETNGITKGCKSCLCKICVRACYQCKEQT